MPARSKQKWLTVDSLKKGLQELVALERDGNYHAVILAYVEVRRDTPFLVRREIRDMTAHFGDLIEQHEWWFASLDDAREQWKSQCFAARG